MKTTYKILIVLVVLGFVVFGNDYSYAGVCQTVVNFDAGPNPVPFNQTVAFSGSVTLSGFEPPGTTNAGYCMWDGKPVRALRIDLVPTGFNVPDINIQVTPRNSSPYPFLRTIKPSDFNLRPNSSFTIRVDVYSADSNERIVRSSTITVNLTVGVYGAYGCVAADGKYACSPGNLDNCSDVPDNACQNRQCLPLSDSRQCNQPAPSSTHKECRNNACVVVPGAGTDQCANDAACAGRGGGGGTGTTTTYNFSLKPPTGIETFQDLVNVIGRWIFNLAIPIAVIMIIWAGVLMLTSGGKPEQFGKGMKALKYAVIGLAVVLIGKGFVSLIRSILDLRN